MSSIAAGTTSGTALVSTGDTTGALVLQTNGTTTAVTIGTNQVVTLAQPLPVASGGTGGSATPTAGGIVYGTGTVQAVTAAGTSGQFLQSNGASAPSWVAASSGALTLLSTVTASSSSTVDIETTFNSTYDTYLIVANAIKPSNDGSGLYCRLKIGGSYLTAGYKYYVFQNITDSATVNIENSNSSAQIALGGTTSNDASVSGANFIMRVYNPSSSVASLVDWKGNNACYGNRTAFQNMDGFGGQSTAGVLTGVRFLFNVGTVSSGSFRLYGIAKT
jgi:hypothetical protein